VSEKNGPRGCDAQALKANSKSLHADNNAPAFKSQTIYLVRRFGLTAAHAATVAQLHFGEVAHG
jgi:hypothetical protein